MKKPTAIILTGALAKGPFHAGSLKVITKNPDIDIKTIIASSSGAINAIALAAGIVSNSIDQAIETMIDAWIEKGHWKNVIDFTIKGLWHRQGISTSNKLKSLIKSNIEKIAPKQVYNQVELKFILTQLSGRIEYIHNQPFSTFENIASFNENDLCSAENRENIYTSAVASAAFPGIFTPVNVDGFGMCYDGGIVNSAPLIQAFEHKNIERIIIISPFPSVSKTIKHYKGLELVSRVANAATDERLYRDLLYSNKANEVLMKLENFKFKNLLTDLQLKEVGDIFYNKNQIEIIQIRPKNDLMGNSFSGLFKKELRIHYVEEGIRAAEETTF